jgi:hypothetical protein
VLELALANELKFDFILLSNEKPLHLILSILYLIDLMKVRMGKPAVSSKSKSPEGAKYL